MKPVFLHQGCLKKLTVLGHAEQFANNIGIRVTGYHSNDRPEKYAFSANVVAWC
jgi:hypothetical protein